MALEDLSEARELGLVHPTYKNGLCFYSAHQAYRLKALLKFRRRGLNWEQAAKELNRRPLYEVSKA